MNKKVVLAMLIVGIFSMGLMRASSIYASDKEENRSSLVRKIATKFGLKESDVQAVFDEEMGSRKSRMKQNFIDRVDQLVKDGKISQEKKDLILKKHDEVESKRDSQRTAFQSMTRGQRLEVQKKEHQEMQEWASANDIDIRLLWNFEGPAARGPNRHR
jgi:hypothetical protein